MAKFFLGVLRRIIVYFMLTVLLLALAFIFTPFFIAQETYKQILAQKIKEMTGKDLMIRGTVELSTVPEITFVFTDAELKDTESGESATIQSAKAVIQVIPFFMGNLDAAGHIKWQGHALDYRTLITQFNRLFYRHPAPLTLTLKSAPYTLDLQGVLQTSSDFRRIVFSETNFMFNGIKGRAGVLVNMEESVPEISAKVAFETLALDEVLALSNIKKSPATQDKSSSWDTEPLPFAAIASLNADIGIRAEQLTYARQSIAQGVNLGILTQDSQANLSMNAEALFGGAARYILSLDHSGEEPAFASELEFTNMNIGALMRAGWNTNILEGTGNGSLKLESKGVSQQDLIANLSGKGQLQMETGKVRGIGLEKLGSFESLYVALFDGKGQETDIRTLDASIAIDKGVIENNDLLIAMPTSSLKGSGVIDLVHQEIEYTLLSKGSLIGSEFGPMPATPITLSGSLFAPDIKADLKLLPFITGKEIVEKGLQELDTFKQVKDRLETIGSDFQKKLEKRLKQSESSE